MLVTSDPSVRFMTKMEIIDNILLLLFAAHDTSRSVLSLVMKYLGQLPQVFEHVLKEQLEISQGKEAGQLLQLEDVQKMKYSWNVASEVMRLSLPVSGAYREAKEDFTYADYNIPKGWNIFPWLLRTNKSQCSSSSRIVAASFTPRTPLNSLVSETSAKMGGNEEALVGGSGIVDRWWRQHGAVACGGDMVVHDGGG
ncbi:hypothetical protein JHK82_022712 [Glycine max]|nr:hypothetical protein JHK85_023204 [Glycine max]KAG5026823.1 hypothetical protein JHK86_022737 [Glycine max]KAG5137981.1 hypothetical protein JHK82_022712 [Glycine max]